MFSNNRVNIRCAIEVRMSIYIVVYIAIVDPYLKASILYCCTIRLDIIQLYPVIVGIVLRAMFIVVYSEVVFLEVYSESAPVLLYYINRVCT